jgi:hypothetical protein
MRRQVYRFNLFFASASKLSLQQVARHARRTADAAKKG